MEPRGKFHPDSNRNQFAVGRKLRDRSAKTLLRNPINSGAHGAKFLVEVFIAPVEMVNTIDQRLTFRDQTGQDEGSAGS